MSDEEIDVVGCSPEPEMKDEMVNIVESNEHDIFKSEDVFPSSNEVSLGLVHNFHIFYRSRKINNLNNF